MIAAKTSRLFLIKMKKRKKVEQGGREKKEEKKKKEEGRQEGRNREPRGKVRT